MESKLLAAIVIIAVAVAIIAVYGSGVLNLQHGQNTQIVSSAFQADINGQQVMQTAQNLSIQQNAINITYADSLRLNDTASNSSGAPTQINERINSSISFAVYGNLSRYALAVPFSEIAALFRFSPVEGAPPNLSSIPGNFHATSIFNGTGDISCSNGDAFANHSANINIEYCNYLPGQTFNRRVALGSNMFPALTFGITNISINSSTPTTFMGTETINGQSCSLFDIRFRSGSGSICFSNVFGLPIQASVSTTRDENGTYLTISYSVTATIGQTPSQTSITSLPPDGVFSSS